MFPHVDWTITPLSIIAALTFITGGLWAWRDHEWRVKNLETWKLTSDISSGKSQENITYLREIAARMQELARGQDRRLVMLEDRNGPSYRVPPL